MFWLGIIIGIILTRLLTLLVSYINNLIIVRKAIIRKIKENEKQHKLGDEENETRYFRK